MAPILGQPPSFSYEGLFAFVAGTHLAGVGREHHPAQLLPSHQATQGPSKPEHNSQGIQKVLLAQSYTA